MARYKYIDTQPRLLAVDLSRQLLPGTFEHALNPLLDHAIDLSHFDARFQNDATGDPAYPPALLLPVVLIAHSQGIMSSRQIERACQGHVAFIALCGDCAPHFTTIAKFVSSLGEDIARVFAAVDSAHHIIVEAQAHGTGAEQELLVPVVTATHARRTADTRITADAGYHCETNLEVLAAMRVTALIADPEMRRRDERLATQDRYTVLPNPLHNKSAPTPALR